MVGISFWDGPAQFQGRHVSSGSLWFFSYVFHFWTFSSKTLLPRRQWKVCLLKTPRKLKRRRLNPRLLPKRKVRQRRKRSPRRIGYPVGASGHHLGVLVGRTTRWKMVIPWTKILLSLLSIWFPSLSVRPWFICRKLGIVPWGVSFIFSLISGRIGVSLVDVLNLVDAARLPVNPAGRQSQVSFFLAESLGQLQNDFKMGWFLLLDKILHHDRRVF